MLHKSLCYKIENFMTQGFFPLLSNGEETISRVFNFTPNIIS